MSEQPVRGHESLPQYYGPDAARPGYVRELFDQAAPDYEWINSVMSFGTGKAYRLYALRSAGLAAGMKVLDIASGTGLVARAAAAVVGSNGLVVGLDPSRGMLSQQRPGPRTFLIQGRGEALPLQSGRFDFISLGYGLRHVADLVALFTECARLLAPGGRLLILEFASARPGHSTWAGRLYLKWVVPTLTWWGKRRAASQKVMQYCWDTVEHAAAPEAVLDAMRRAGLVEAAHRDRFGMLAEFSARKP
jgi:demethylmenaquinone methyltransferase/2-methoxy-6-polyprenyl-1,4-benzoquinol methylase